MRKTHLKRLIYPNAFWKCLFFLFVMLLGSFHLARAQTFTEMSYSFADFYGSSDWGDMDNDGDLDVLFTGTIGTSEEASISIYRNNADGTFTWEPTSSLIGLENGVGKWLDFNNDGLLDIFTNGEKNVNGIDVPFCNRYKQTPAGHFELVQDDTFFEVNDGILNWADINNDGLVDITISGYTHMFPNYHSIIYENHDGTFVESTKYKFDQLACESLEWGDYDNDLDLDLLMNGNRWNWKSREYVWETAIYRNDNDSLKKLDAGLIGLNYGSSSWGDFDADGDLDILSTGTYGGWDDETSVFRVYINNGDDSFTPIEMPDIPQIFYVASVWGDIDNDGDLDVLASGRDESFEVESTYLLLNQNGNLVTHSLLCGLQATSLNMVDLDNDGDLDLSLCGWADYAAHTKVYRNDGTVQNLPPSPPANLVESREGNTVTFSWVNSFDDHTASNSLTYNLYVGTSTDSIALVQPYAETGTGFRQIARLGNTGLVTSYSLILENPTVDYIWGVQAIDNSFKGSAFAHFLTVVLPPVVFTDLPSGLDANGINLNGRVNPSGQTLNAWFEYGTDTTQLITTALLPLSGDSLVDVSMHINNLLYNTFYYYRVAAGDVKGEFVTFRTEPDGMEENTGQFMLYPNPSEGLMRYALKVPGNGILTIYDMQGRKRMQIMIDRLSNSGLLDIRHLEKGIFNAIYVNEGSAWSQRIVKN